MVAIVLGCGTSPTSPARVAPLPNSVIASNVLRADYAGSSACADCHSAIYTAWSTSPMRNMTRDAATAKIHAPFTGDVLHVGSDTCTMESDGDGRYMRVTSPDGNHSFKITKVVGGRYREDFVGLEIGGGDGLEHVLPATFVFSTHAWRYKGYSVMVKERPKMSWQGVWSQECIGCHNTLPLATMLYDDIYGPSLPSYQGKMSDRVLPPSRTWPAHAIDETALAKAVGDEIKFLGGAPPETGGLHAMLPAAATTMEAKLDGKHLVELGIGCEACHNGARDHATEPSVKPAFAAQSQLLAVGPPPGQTGTKAQWINHTCAKCHTVLFTRYPWTWEGGKRRDRNPGGSSISSGEGRDFQLGGCSTQMACTTCHDPHVEDGRAKLDAMATPAGNHLCTQCHSGYATDAAVEKHTHHKLGGAGTACIACHMAKKNMGLDYVLNRYHRIGSPTDPKRVLGDRPLECALCHADKSVEQIVSTMETWWHKTYDRAALHTLYGADLSVNVVRATLALGKAHEQAVAISTYGELKDRSAIPALVPMLAHEYPLVRYFTQRALQSITGDPVAIDVGAPTAEVTRAANVWLAQHAP